MNSAFLKSANSKDFASFNEVIEVTLRNLNVTAISEVQNIAKVDEFYAAGNDDRHDMVAVFEKVLSGKRIKF